MTMTKGEFIKAVADKTGFSKRESETAVNAFIACIEDALSEGKDVVITNFGKFALKERAARKGINLQTKQQIKISACTVATFKPGKKLKTIAANAKKS